MLDSALGELMNMSDEELLSSLDSMSEGGAEAPDAESNAAASSEAEDADASPAGDSGTESGSDEESLPEQAASSTDTDTEIDDGIRKDPVTLALIKAGVVDVDTVSAALRSWDGTGQLWRHVASSEGADAERVFAAVARSSGYPSYTYLDAAPTRELIDELVPHIGEESLCSILDRGLLPVDLEPTSDESNYRIMLVTHDPSDETILETLESAGVNGVFLFAPRAQVRGRIETVRTWIDSPFGLASEANGIEAYSDDEPSIGDDTAGDDYDYHGDGQPSGRRVNGAPAPPLEISEFDPLSTPAEDAAEDKGVIQIPSDDESEDLPSMLAPASRDRVMRTLLQKKIVSQKQVQQGIAEWQKNNGKDALWRVVASLPGVNREAMYEEAARLYAFKHEEVVPGRPDFDFVVLTMETVAEDQREELLDLLLLPFEHVIDYDTGAGRMVFVTPDPTRPEVSRLLHELDLGRFELRYAPESAIGHVLEELYPRKNEYLERMTDDAAAFDFGTSYEEAADIVDEEALDAEINRSKLINLFEATLVEATRLGASDIHIIPNPKRQVEIHFRLDGRLKKWHTEEGVSPEAFISVVKDNSVNVDRFERDAAQDGYIQRKIDETLIRFRVSILPIASANQELRAESIVIRILDDRKVITELRQLGMLETALARFDQAIRQPHGMVILTGPTGSGKSTTLVAALHQVVTSEVNVLTVEDPVEYIINGVRQIKLSHKLDLEQALRSILRHDPDIVMVGEMRDRQTAELAIKLANTGHLTFSTLHTNDAPAAVSRLYKMGVEPFLIAYAINLVVAQRLIRTLCPTCKKVNENPDAVLMRSLGWTDEEIDKTTVYEASFGARCKTCGGIGYKGRRALCETLYFTDEVRHLIAESGTDIDEESIRAAGVKDGMLTLRDSGRKLVELGETSLQETLRVTGAE